MAILLDPEKREALALHQMVGAFAGRRVLEIGCGSGRVTWLYADEAAEVMAIDPDEKAIAQAIADCPPQLSGRVTFLACDVDHFQPSAPFDLAILSWAL